MDGLRTRIVAVAVLTGAGLALTGWENCALGDVDEYASSPMVGMNIGGLSNQSSSWMLSNYYLSAGGWNYFPDGSPSGGYDSEGDPILGGGQSAGQNIFLQNSTNIYDLGGTLNSVDYPGGVYTVTWTGTGTIQMSGDAVPGTSWTSYGNESTVNSETFTVVPGTTSSGGGLYMFDIYASNSNYNSTTDPVSNIHVYAPTYAPGQVNAGQNFTTQFTQGLKPFGTLRFMDAMNTNSDSTAWSSSSTSTYPGPQLSDETWTGSAGMPVAAMVALANQTHTDPWFCIPVAANAAYVTQFATYVKNNLASGLKVYVEYGNEDWSTATQTGQYIQGQSGGAGNGPTFDGNWASDAAAVFKDWESVYTGSSSGVSSQLVRVAAIQTSNSYDAPIFLTDLKNDGGFDAVADAAYFNGNANSYTNATTAQQILNDMIASIQSQASTTPSGTPITDGGTTLVTNAATGDWAWNKQLANYFGVPLIGYEGGQGLSFNGTLSPTTSTGTETALYAAYVLAEESPQMEQIYDLWLQTYLNQVGASEVNAYGYTGAPGEYGAWGTVEYPGQPDPPKYDGMVDYLTGAPEPATAGLLAPAAFLLLVRRRRRSEVVVV